MSGVLRLLRVSRPVADLARSVAFYRDALGFSAGAEAMQRGPFDSELTGVPGVRARSTMLRLGDQQLELVAFDPPGRAYPPQSRATDLWFQHVAIVVGDIAAAHARLCRQPFAAISEHGPQQLPPNTGSVSAYKFRDPDGHPLELIRFPPGAGDPRWQRPGLFLGIDHSAIAVADIAQSVAFYTRLGLSAASRTVNSGPAQQRLDGTRDAVVEVVALQPIAAGPPHVELLGYAGPSGRPIPVDAKPNDLFATRLVLQVDDLPHLVETLAAQGASFVSPGIVADPGGRPAALLRDPTGHLLMLCEP